jgi:outer membrane protein assembly factor BamB
VLDLGDRLEVIDLQTGAKRWDTTTLPIGNPKGYLAAPERGLLLVYGVIQDSGALAAVDLASGELRWRQANPFRDPPKRGRELTSGQREKGSSLGEEPPVLWVTDSTFLLYVSEDGPVLVNASTGAFLWRADHLKGKERPALRNLYPPSVLAESVVYAPTERELYAIRLRDGTPFWSAPVGLPSRVLQLELTPQGLLVRGVRREKDAIRDGSFVDLLDPGTGASRWPKQFKKGWSVLHASDAPAVISPFVWRGDRVYCVTDEKLYALSLSDGARAELGKVTFKGDEEPAVLENRADGILLLSPQNVLLADTTGAVRYQTYYPAPPMGLLGQIGTVLLQAAFNVASYSLAQSAANRTGVPQTYRQYDNPFLRIRYAAAELPGITCTS